MAQGYSSGGSQGSNNTPLNSSVYNFNNMQGSIANFLKKEIDSFMKGQTYNPVDRTTSQESARDLSKLDDVISALNNVAENIKVNFKEANNIKDSDTSPALEKLNAELQGIITATSAVYKDNIPQLLNQATLSMTDLMTRTPDVTSSLLTIEGANGNVIDNKGSEELQKLQTSEIAQLLNHAQVHTNLLTNIDRTLMGIASAAGISIPAMLMSMDQQDDKEAEARQNEEEDWFEGLGSTISKTLFNHPGINKMGQVLGQLGNLALIRGVLSNPDIEKDHPVLHKAAALAVYFQLPQLAVNLMGAVFQQAVSNWLVNSIGPKIGQGLTSMFKTLGPQLGNIFKFAMNPITIGTLLILGGIAAGIKGIIDHHKNMKNIDAEIDNDPRLSKNQKELAKMKEHSKSGAKVGRLSGALVGAGTGAIVGATAGAAAMGIGAIPGAIIGGIGGLLAGLGLGDVVGRLIGGLKPAFALIGNILVSVKNATIGAFKGLWSSLKGLWTPILNTFKWFVGINVNAFKWMFGVADKIMSFVKPVLKFVGDIVSLLSPIALIFRGIKAVIDWVKEHFNIGGKGSDSPINETNKPFGTNHPTLNKVAETIAHPIEAAKAAKKAQQSGVDVVSMRNLGLHGKIDKGNSVPYIAKKNAEGLRQLDGILKSWGYDTVYTSAMGGHTKGGHVKGNKVDFQLLQNGKTAHLSQEQLNYLQSLGYWGGKTGALGWEKVNGQVGGGHYDINTSNVKITEPYVQAFEEEKRKAKEKEEEEKRKKEEEKNKKEQPKQDKQQPSIWDRAKNYVQTSYGDITGSGEAISSFTGDKTKVGGMK